MEKNVSVTGLQTLKTGISLDLDTGGTPIPIWRCECGHLESAGSRAELAEKAVEDVNPDTIELHRPYVDDIHFKCPCCGKTMERIPEVMDCWFDSGAMPYAQVALSIRECG